MQHLKQLSLIDAQLFSDTVESVGGQATAVIQRDSRCPRTRPFTAIIGPDRTDGE